MDPEFSSYEHNRHPNIPHITTHRRSRANTTLNSSLHTLMEAFNNLPNNQKSEFYRFSQLRRSESPKSPVKRKIRRASTLVERKTSSQVLRPISLSTPNRLIWEIPYKDAIYSTEFIYKIFIGNTIAANDENLLRTSMIDSVLMLGLEGSPEKFTSVRKGYLCLEVDDDLIKTLDSAQRFLDAHLKQGNVIVVCPTGIRLAPAVIIGYFIRRFGIIFSYARDYVAKYVQGLEISPEHTKQLKFLSLQNNVNNQ